MKELKITTIRRMSDDDWQVYKKQVGCFLPVNFEKLEKEGKQIITQSMDGEDVMSIYELKNDDN